MVYHGEDLSSILYRSEESDFAVSQFERLHVDGPELLDDDGQITPNSIWELEDPLVYRGSTCPYTSSMDNSGISMEPEVVKKKKKGSGFLPGIELSLSNRRKGAPHRSPLS